MSQEQMYQLVAIIIYMAVLLAIGWYAYKKTSKHRTGPPPQAR